MASNIEGPASFPPTPNRPLKLELFGSLAHKKAPDLHPKAGWVLLVVTWSEIRSRWYTDASVTLAS